MFHVGIDAMMNIGAAEPPIQLRRVPRDERPAADGRDLGDQGVDLGAGEGDVVEDDEAAADGLHTVEAVEPHEAHVVFDAQLTADLGEPL